MRVEWEVEGLMSTPNNIASIRARIAQGERPEEVAASLDISVSTLRRATNGEGVNAYTARRIEQSAP
jgi:DNA invertase Pin-like site-specific DNA recombinase